MTKNDFEILEKINSFTFKVKCKRCGRISTKRKYNFNGKHHLSCRCVSAELKVNPIKLLNKRIYSILVGMRSRCNLKDINSPDYELYANKGIKVCESWSDNEIGFINFYIWSINNNYSDNLSIDRIDSSKDYSPENCRWATSEVQANNTSRNVTFTYNGKTQTIAQWCKELNLKPSTVNSRRNRDGKSIKEALGLL